MNWKKQCEKKCFCQAVVLQEVTSGSRKPSFFSYYFVAKEKENRE